MKKILLIALMILMTASFAQANENWAGSYGGLSLGVLMGTTTVQDYDEDLVYGEASITEAAYTVGILGGHNWLYGPAGFYGLEVDFNWTSFSPERVYWTDYRNEAEWNWYSTIRARGGLAFDKTLLFVSAGIAIVDGEYRVGEINDLANDDNVNSKKTEVGYTAGAGVEFAIDDNTSVRGEYLYIGLPSDEKRYDDEPVDFTSSANIFRFAVIRGF